MEIIKRPRYRIEESKRYQRYYTRIVPLFNRPVTKAYMGVILSLFTISFFGYFAIKPTVNTISELYRKIEDGKITSKLLSDKIKALSTAQNTFFELSDSLPLVDQALPSESSIDSYIKRLENVILASRLTILGTKIDQFKVEGPAPKVDENKIRLSFTPLQTVVITISAEGGYTEVLDFLSSLHRLRRLTNIESLTINSGTEKENDLIVTVRANTFYYR